MILNSSAFSFLINAVFMKYQGIREIYSYDEDFETIEDIERKEP
jgi:predicted nucleic acid-binding protein